MILQIDRPPRDDAAWAQMARALLKAHLKLVGMSYADLSESLAALGVDETEPAIRGKVNRGDFRATFLLQCLRAMQVKQLLLPTDATDLDA